MITFQLIGEAGGVLFIACVLILFLLVTVDMWHDLRQRTAQAPQPELGDDVVAKYGSAANADAELAALTDADALARDCPACTGPTSRPWCCCVKHCGSQACRAGQAVWHG